MKRTILLTVLLLISAGCSSITGTRKAPDGSVLTLKCNRFLWSSEGVTFSLSDTNGASGTNRGPGGISIGLGMQKSNPDAQTIQALVQGANSLMGTAVGAAASTAAKP